MANSLAALRADIARMMGKLITGTVTAGDVGFVTGHGGLAEYDEAGALRRPCSISAPTPALQARRRRARAAW